MTVLPATETTPGGASPVGETPIGPWLVVGLGNPGARYERHRHNAGYRAVEELAARLGGRFRAHKSRVADVVEARLPAANQTSAGPRVILVRPRSYMNTTGRPVASMMGFYRVEPGRLVVVHDELDVPFPALRVKFGGGDNGHNGLRSIRASLGSGEYFRIRMGIGRPTTAQPVTDFVLSAYPKEQAQQLPEQVSAVADATVMLITRGLAATQSVFNRGLGPTPEPDTRG
ncbi:MAG: aminoacyl-tRNA hydrolase [Nocardioides sp.]